MADSEESTNLNQKSTEEEYIPFFLDNLRNQLFKIFLNFTDCQQEPATTQSDKLILDQSQFVNTSNCTDESSEFGQTVRSELNDTFDSLPGNQSFATTSSFNADDSFNLSNSPYKQCKEPFEQHNGIVAISSSPSHHNKINSCFKFDKNSFPSLIKENQGISDVSATENRSATSDVNNSNCSTKNKDLINCESPPHNLPVIKNKSFDSYLDSNSSVKYITSTPNNRSKQLSKSFNSRSPNPMNLGDFITIGKIKNSSGRKKKEKPINEDHLVDSTQQNTSNKHKRRINTIKLVLTNEKKTEENTVFKGVEKQYTLNSHFANSSEIDKLDESVLRQNVATEIQEENVRIFDTNFPCEEKFRVSTVIRHTVVIPNVELVNNKEALKRLAMVYSECLDKNLVINLMSELHFIFKILISQYKLDEPTAPNCLGENLKDLKISSKKELESQFNDQSHQKNFEKNDIKKWNTLKNDIQTFLNTPHDCVYFASEVLSNQKAFLKCLNRPTLKLLSENKNIETFQPELCKYIDTIYNSKVVCNNEQKSVNISKGESNACFQLSRDSFISEKAFFDFKKQRDIFYEILKKWMYLHLDSGWSFAVLKSHIRKIFLMETGETNLNHLTQLFTIQLLHSCLNSTLQSELIDEETTDFLKNLKDFDSEKLSRLNQKLITPSTQCGPVPFPSFPGIQEFYYDFIKHTESFAFRAHLEHTLTQEILKFNDSQFTTSDIDEAKSKVDKQTKHEFSVCLTKLGILGKFLGFVTSLQNKTLASVFQRGYIPHVDLQYCLYNAIEYRRLSLTVPWIVEYLAMLDERLYDCRYYKKILEILYIIYRASCCGNLINSDKSMSGETILLIKLSIGWLFDLPKFPKEMYYVWQSKYSDKLNMVQYTLETRIHNEFSSISEDIAKDELVLDTLDLIDDAVLYDYCPFLKNLHTLLVSQTSRLNSTVKLKYTTPVTYQLQRSTQNTCLKQVQIELEKSFFNLHKSSKKTVEFVSERTASNCKKYIFRNLLQAEKDKLAEEMKQMMKEGNQDHVVMIQELAKKASESIAKTIQKPILEFCEKYISRAIRSLLVQSYTKDVQDMCIRISTRITIARINEWMVEKDINNIQIFIKHLVTEKENYKQTAEKVAMEKVHNSEAASPTEVLDGIRKLIWRIMDPRGKHVSEEELVNFWDQVHQSLTERSDSKPTTQKTILSSSIDLCLMLIAHQDGFIGNKALKKIFETWEHEQHGDLPFSRLLCTRNVALMSQSRNQSTTWSNFGKFLRKLLHQGILTLEMLKKQLEPLLNCDQEVRNNWLPLCLREALVDHLEGRVTVQDEDAETIRYIKTNHMLISS